MQAYIIRRLLLGVFVIIGVLTLVFFSLHLAPGDPIALLIPAEAASEGAQEIAMQLRAKYGLDQPLYVQYFRYLGNAFVLDFGTSIRTKQPVFQGLVQRYPATIELASFSLLVAMLVGIPAGIVAALHQNSTVDNLCTSTALLGVSLPNFWLGLLLMLLFSVQLGWLPPSGRGGPFWTLAGLQCLIMPVITTGIRSAGSLARLTRSAMLDVRREDYIRTARSKGLGERAVIYKHALRNAFIPVITVLGLQLGALLSGAVIAETVFAWPGVGRYMVMGITGHDFPVVQGGVVVIALTFVAVNLFVDITYAWLDPRIAYS